MAIVNGKKINLAPSKGAAIENARKAK